MTDENMESFSALVAEPALSECDGFRRMGPDVLNDGGSNCPPQEYGAVTAAIDSFFQKLMEEHEVDMDSVWY